MIGRLWRGWTIVANADAYAILLRTKILPGIHRIKGCKGAYLLRRDVAERLEFATLTLWESLDAIRAFAGEDYEVAVIIPEARKPLSRFHERSLHHETIMEPRGGL